MTFTRKPHAVALGGSADDVEMRFYETLQRGDLDELMALWADEDDVVCIRPGGPRAVGLPAIRAAFEALFARGVVVARPQQVRRLQQIGCALHHLVERVELPAEGGGSPQTAWVVATNFYVKTAQGWRLAAHHSSSAGAGAADEAAAPAPEVASSTLH